MSTATVEKHEFQAEAKQLLDLMIHSVYSNKDIFLRELISNASDALDKMRVEALTNEDLAAPEDLHIRVEASEGERTITVGDNGIGMTRDEVQEYIGTIAKSGTRQFLDQMKKMKDESISPELIGQFGVGFYSSFMVADKITLVTRKAGEDTATRWESTGDGSYTLEETERATHGTTITLHLAPAEEEDALHDYTKEWKIREIVKQYSDFVTYPIRMEIERKEIERDEEGNPKPEAEEKTITEDVVLNSMKAIWTRSESDVTEEEYNEFYKHLSHDWSDPLAMTRIRGEGTIEFYALLYIPARAPMDIQYREFQKGIHLYVKRVFIMDDCDDLMPNYLRFIKGVVDSEDLSLNISREILQQNRQIRQIRKRLVRKALDTLEALKKDEAEKYKTFWGELGRVLKEGMFEDLENRDRILPLCYFNSTDSADEQTSLDDYVERMKDGQEKIYYLTGDSRVVIENSPHLEAFREKGYEVLLLDDPVDEVWLQQELEFDGKKLESIGKGAAELGTEEERKEREEELKEKQENLKDLLECIQGHLSDYVKEVRLSSRLTKSPVCLVGEEFDMTPQLEQMMKQMGQKVPESKRILEINPDHEILSKLGQLFLGDKTDTRLAEYSTLLYGQALLAEGSALPDPAAYSKLVADLMVRSLS